ncbi:alkaline phosphatase family protein [Marinimicrococcus flavescens]|uniref:Alkaline phosphatase family protein n=1 Tax=Marinimicrococcus flavescens TaxID=3031815 RepID=A0AAP3XST7_9PROT|nr:alkaline phosphatase family protein [Marinimicrococcus flavescens]
MTASRVLVLALELGDGPLICRWAQEGRLPAIRALLERGRSGPLATTAELLHVSPLPSLYTGTGPGEHGVYFTFQPAPGLQGWQRFQEGIYGQPSLWQLASEQGRRCTVLDAPYTHPEPGYQGLQILNWGTWAHYLPPGSTPPGLLRELEKACGAYPLGLEAHDIGFMELDPADMSRRLVEALRRRAEASRWLMRRQPWDLFFTVLDESHPAAHYCWRPDGGGESQPHLLAVYEELDRTVAALVEEAGPEATVILVSGDAIGPNHAGWHLLPEILARLGLFSSADLPADGAQKAAAPRDKKLDPVKALRDLLPTDLRKSLARMLPTALRDRLAKRVDTAAIDWARTKAYCLLTDLEGCIRINLKGREPEGIVEPGAEHEALCAEIEEALGALVNPATGRPAVARVLRAGEAFPGPRRDWLPDLVVLWDREAPITALASPRIGTVAGPSPDHRPGTHAGPGFAVVAGPGVAPGALPAGAHIEDLAPAVLAALGCTVPSHMTGNPRNFLQAAAGKGA